MTPREIMSTRLALAVETAINAAGRFLTHSPTPRVSRPRVPAFALAREATLLQDAPSSVALVLPDQRLELWTANQRDIVSGLLAAARYSPRRVLRMVRRIEAATSWFEARIAGMDRAAAHALDAQRGALSQLEAEVALDALRRPR